MSDARRGPRRGDVGPPLRRARRSSAARPTSRASARGSTCPSSRCSRRSRSTCAAQAPRRGLQPSTLTVRIGSEVPHEGFATTSVVTTGYGPGEEALGTLGVLGPTRMDYPGAMASVRAVAQYLVQDPRRRLTEPVSQDPYEILGVAKDADADDDQEGLPQAGPPAAPGREPGPRRRRSGSRTSPAPTRSSRDPDKRRQYDMGGDVVRRGFGGGAGAGFSFSDIMDAFFGGAGGGSRGRGRGPRPRVRRGQDALIHLDVDLAEAAFGTTRELKVDTAVLCTHVPGRAAPRRAPGPRTLRHLPGPRRDVPRAAVVPGRGPDDASLRRLPRLRPDHPGALPGVRGRRACPLAPHPDGEDPRRRRRRHPRAALRSRARSARAVAPPATSTSSSTSARTTSSCARAETCTASVEVPMTAAALGATITLPTLESDLSDSAAADAGLDGTPGRRGRGRHPSRHPVRAPTW